MNDTCELCGKNINIDSQKTYIPEFPTLCDECRESVLVEIGQSKQNGL